MSDKLDLGAIEAKVSMLTQHGKEVQLAILSLALEDAPALVAELRAERVRVRELEEKLDAKTRLLEIVRESRDKTEAVALEWLYLLRRVLAWRGLDGDGIDKSLRTEIEEALP